MTIKRILALIFALIMTLSLVACGGESETETTAPETTKAIPETTAEVIDSDLHIVEGGASEWALIRPEISTEYEVSAMQSLRNLVKEKYGITMKLDTDGKRMPGSDPEYQILIGRTDEPESADAIAFIDSIGAGNATFVIEAREKRLVIVATNISMYEKAIKYLEENMENFKITDFFC